MSSLFIDEGLTLDGTAKARPGIHPELRYRFRPALGEGVQGYVNAIQRGGDDRVVQRFIRPGSRAGANRRGCLRTASRVSQQAGRKGG
jgi:hypothetical protein